MILSLSTGSLFTLPLQRVFELAAESGFDGVGAGVGTVILGPGMSQSFTAPAVTPAAT